MPSRKRALAQVWRIKYLIDASVSWEEEAIIKIGINESILSSMPNQIESQLFLDKERSVPRMVVDINTIK